jgi:tRNA threonylcarbamoyl adenosine modification protein YjeE
MSIIRAWKKVFETDLSNIVIELKEVLQTPCLLFLEGPVGAGKTTFVRAFLEEKEVQSPTYSLVLEYDNILHADLYRIEKKEDLIHLEPPMYLEEKDYFIVMNDKTKHLASKTMANFEEVLQDNSLFFRAHKSHIVNLKFIKQYIRGEGGEIIMQDGKNVALSRNKKQEFLSLFKKV